MRDLSNTQFYILLVSIVGGIIWQRVDHHRLNGQLDRISDDW